MLKITIDLKNKTKRGPGLSKLNIRTLESETNVKTIRDEFEVLIKNAPGTWDPHTKLDYAKAVFSGITKALDKKTKFETKTKGELLKNELDQAHLLLERKFGTNNQVHSESQVKAKERLIRSISNIEKELEEFVNSRGEFLARLSRSKWYNEGEKSNKYFLNIMNYRESQKNITEIENESGQKITDSGEIQKYITEFYKNLYCKEEIDLDEIDDHIKDNFFKDVPKLSENDSEYVESPLTLEELTAALNTCKNTTPGPDGIPYDFYKKYWDIWGNIILDSWAHSLNIGKLSPSNLTSVITLLPKEGKDPKKIGNWRPISLTNCDLKIITKAYALRLAKVADSIIHPNQTAYVPGRSVMDNLRAIKELARNNATQAEDTILISLDAKKAFDSVSHKYIRMALEKYGFGEKFIKVFTTLYTDLKARVLVNGWQSEVFEILKGVKQGDALSCILFIICIDPLIRNINKNNRIAPSNPRQNVYEMKTKAFGYADDVSALIKDDNGSVQELFSEYEKLTLLSNLTLNADKTEIVHFKKLPTRSRINRSGFPILHPALRDHIQRALRAHSNSMFPQGNTIYEHNNTQADIPSEEETNTKIYKFKYNNVEYNLATVESLKICGITFSADPHIAYDRNIRDKIKKLKKQLDRWKPRNLSILGKILIVKTFGLSQLIYSLQCCEIENSELKEIEQIILAYIWKKKEGNSRFTERIKRENIYKTRLAGGFAALNPYSLDKALKIRTVLRATTANHPIKLIQ
jgi:hypothetical protein